ncbi:MAG: transporter substrate-binding domain-containing protein [Planctomycetota bacterium]
MRTPSLPTLFAWLVSGLLTTHLLLSNVAAQANAPAQGSGGPPREVTIATKITPPFIVKDGDGGYSGLSIDLWNMVAQKLNLRATFVEHDLQGMLTAAERGDVDLALAAVTVTPEREKRMDFSHPFLSSGLGIATRGQSRGMVSALVDRLFSFELLQALGALVLVLAVCGVLTWLAERHANPEQFGGGGLKGPAEGFWFSAVTMTTVGYGDKAPVTFAGRAISLVWMFASVMIISGYTASIASALTLDQLQSTVRGREDLPHVRIATLGGSAAAGWLDKEALGYRNFATVEAAVKALETEQVDAVVYDAPILKSLLLGKNELLVLPGELRSEQYAIAMREGSELREQLNPALLEVLQSEQWLATRKRYLGE